LRICIVTPGQIGSNPRVVKEAQTLFDEGLRVSVIATRTLDSVEARDQSILQQAPYPIERIDLRSKLQWRSRRVTQIAFRAAHAATGLASLSARAFSAYAAPLTAAALRTPADLYIAHYPPALPAAFAAARRYGARYAFDAEDFHLGDWPDDAAYDRERRLLGSIERQALPHCAYVTASSPMIADAYAEAYGIVRPRVVLNAFPLAQAAHGPTARGCAEPGPSVYWFSQVIGPNRGLECAVRAIGQARTRPHLYLRGQMADGFAQRLSALALEARADGHVHILPPALPAQMERLAAAYDLGLCSEPAHTTNNAFALSNKLFSYMLAGVPAVLSDTIAQRAFAAGNENAMHVYPSGDSQALAAALDRLLADPKRLAAARAAAYRLGRESYNWERESQKLVELVRQSLGAPSRREAGLGQPA